MERKVLVAKAAVKAVLKIRAKQVAKTVLPIIKAALMDKGTLTVLTKKGLKPIMPVQAVIRATVQAAVLNLAELIVLIKLAC